MEAESLTVSTHEYHGDMLAMVLLLATGPQTLHATPEWKAFEQALASKPQWQVLVMNKLHNGPNFQFGSIRNGLKIGYSEKIQYVWDGSKGIALNWRNKTYQRFTSATEFDHFYKNGHPFFMTNVDGPLTHLMAYDGAGKKVKSGWSWRYQGRDYEWEATYWFDSTSKLLTEFAYSGTGMVSLPEYSGMYRLHWTFQKEHTKDWSLTPPADYKRG